MSKTLQRVTNIVFAVLLATFSVNLTGVMTLNAAHADNNGTLKTHEKGSPSGSESNQPKVCDFNFEGFSFDKGQSGLIVVTPQSPSPDTNGTVSVPFGPTDNTGYAQTAYINDGGNLSLPNGHYTSTLYGKDQNNNYTIDLKAKSKVFWVDCTSVTPTAPTFSDLCGTANDTYTIPTTTGVTYYVNGVVATAGTYAGSGTVTITAVAQDGYVLTGTTSWSQTFTNIACTITVQTVAPTVANDTCGTANDTYTIPSVTGVNYYVNGVLTAAGTYHTGGASSVTITAQPQTGYTLQGQTSWTLTFNTTPCPVQVTPAAPTKTDVCGTAQDGYTIVPTTGVIYEVNGKPVTGFNPATGTVTITAIAASGYVLTGTTSWTFTFSSMPCPIEVTPTAPTFSDLCGGIDDDTFTIPVTTGVTYYIKVGLSYVPIKAGTHAAFGTVTIKAVANQGYVLSEDATTVWTNTFNSNPCPITPTAPTSVDQCGTANDTYTIPTAAHVTYKKLVGYWMLFPIYQTVTAGTYPGTGTVTIVAFADHDYTINGQSTWTFTFDSAPCDVVVVPTAPTKTDLCGTNQDGYTIPNTTGVTYEVNGQPVTAGFHAATSPVTITAVSQKGYVLNEDYPDTWTFTFTNVACPCTPSTVTLQELTLSAMDTSNDNCTPGQGGAGGETPTPPAPTTQVTELPETGPADSNTALKLATIVFAGIATYGAMYFIVNRRSLLQK